MILQAKLLFSIGDFDKVSVTRIVMQVAVVM